MTGAEELAALFKLDFHIELQNLLWIEVLDNLILGKTSYLERQGWQSDFFQTQAKFITNQDRLKYLYKNA